MGTRPLSVATHLAPSVQPLYELITRQLGNRLGRHARLVVADSYERCAADVDDVCFVCSIPFLLFARDGRIHMDVVAAPVLAGKRYGGRPVYFSDVIVARDSSLRHFSDLRGCRWAFNEPFSQSGYIVVWHHLLSRGYGGDFFGEMVEAGFHQEAIRLVADGGADAAAIDSQVLEIAFREEPELASRLRIIDTMGPSTIQPVVASSTRLSSDERHSILDTLLELGSDEAARPVLAAAGVERFVALQARDYDDVRGMLDGVEHAGVLPAAWYARWEQIVSQASGDTGGATLASRPAGIG